MGVFEDRSKASGSNDDSAEDEDSSLSSNSSSSSALESESDSDSDSDASEDHDVEILMAATDGRPIKPLPKRASAHPGIVLLQDPITPDTEGNQ